jgi:D-3-phosphoglycerate dehydrogenase
MMVNQFSVYVFRDWRVEDRGFTMGLDNLMNDPDIEVSFVRGADEKGGSMTGEELEGANAVVALVDDLKEESLQSADDLRIVAKYGAGFDNIDLEACADRGIPVANAPQAPTRSVAQAALGKLLICASNLAYYSHHVEEYGFGGPRLENMGTEFFGKTLGLVGTGRIGEELVSLVEPFDVDVIAYDPYVPAEKRDQFSVEFVDLDQLVARADFVSINCPLTDETRHMLTEDHFKTMKESMYLVNTARGGIYEDETLARAVDREWIAGAAVDVFETEPVDPDNPLLGNPRCLTTPHIAGLTEEALTGYGELASSSILAVKNGEIPRNLLNPEVYDREVPEEKLSPSHQPD